MRNYFYLLLAFTLIPICSIAQMFGGQLKSAKVGTIGSLNCSTATNNGTLTAGTTASNVSSSVPYTGGNGGTYSAQTITSTGVTDLTATLAAGTLLSGSGSITYTITGTPASSGTASFALSLGGQTCTLTRTVATSSTGCGNQSTVTDIDGNVYPVVSIGSQCWMKENLKVSKYRNGDPIPIVLMDAAWSAATTGAYAIYDNDASNNTTYGKLYNWYAVADSRNLCPTGWHIPSDTEWKLLEIFLGMIASDADLSGYRGSIQNIGGKLKSTSSLWTAPNTGATNESGFSGLPGGARNSVGKFGNLSNVGYFWSATEGSSTDAWLRLLSYSNVGSYRNYDNSRRLGFSVRCLRDATETGSINTLDCGGATNNGTLTQGLAAASVSSIVPYTGGNGGTYSAQTITSTGVTGLTATLAAGSLLSGAGSLTYTITGTPATSGTASFALSFGGQTCSLSRTVNTGGSGPLNIETGLIPTGTFTMGSPVTELERGSDEVQHQVTLSAFRMSKYEITNAQYAGFLNAKGIGSNGIYSAGAYPFEVLIYENTSRGLIWTGTQWQPVAGKEIFPVVKVTWFGAAEFATYAGGRLPTEAEWEYACRGNTTTPFSTGACLNNTQANYNWNTPLTGCTNTITNSLNVPEPVNSYSPNAYGLYNMHGNAWEWCADWYGDYSTTTQTNPTGPASGIRRVFRGGCAGIKAGGCRSGIRYYEIPNLINSLIGFRLAFAP